MKKAMTPIVAGVLIYALAACSQTNQDYNYSAATESGVISDHQGETSETVPSGEMTTEKEMAEGIPEEDASISASTVAPGFIESEESVLSNSLFSVTMPENTAGSYVAELYEESIVICEKESRDGGYGGQVFTIQATDQLGVGERNPSIRKYGELTAEDGIIYDIMVSRPTDVRFGPDSYDSYMKLQDTLEQVMTSLKGTGKGVYVSEAGIKGEDLYNDVLEKYITALTENWSAVRLQDEDMNPFYELMQKIYDGNALDHIGYAYIDVTNEGVDELLIGEVSEEDNRNIIYDIYGIENHSPVHVLSGSSENRYYLEGNYLCNEFMGINGEKYIIFHDNDYLLGDNRMNYDSHGVDKYKIDPKANPEQPWFIESYENDTWGWKNITEAEYKEYYSRMIDENFELEFRPLSERVFEK